MYTIIKLITVPLTVRDAFLLFRVPRGLFALQVYNPLSAFVTGEIDKFPLAEMNVLLVLDTKFPSCNQVMVGTGLPRGGAHLNTTDSPTYTVWFSGSARNVSFNAV